MRQHALKTSLTLYRSGTLDLETAAARAGVSPERFRVAVARLGDVPVSPTVESDRIPVGAD